MCLVAFRGPRKPLRDWGDMTLGGDCYAPSAAVAAAAILWASSKAHQAAPAPPNWKALFVCLLARLRLPAGYSLCGVPQTLPQDKEIQWDAWREGRARGAGSFVAPHSKHILDTSCFISLFGATGRNVAADDVVASVGIGRLDRGQKEGATIMAYLGSAAVQLRTDRVWSSDSLR